MNRHALLGSGTTDGDGGFHIETPRTASIRFFEVYALAAAPGFGLGWTELNPDAGKPTAEIRLRPQQIIRGKPVDINGQAAAGVELRIGTVGQPTKIGTYDGVSLWDARLEGMRAWPRSVTTDNQGRITLPGIGRDLMPGLEIRDIRFAQQSLRVQTNGRDASKEATMVLEPATVIEGRVLAADTGQPIPTALISVMASRGEIGSMSTTRFRADDRGQFTANPSPGDYFRLAAQAPEGKPYLIPQVEFAWTKGAVKKVIDVKLPRGVLIQGRVTQRLTGRPLASASVQYIPAKNPDNVLGGWQAVVASSDDGSYQIVVPPGKGHLFVYGPTADYVLETIGTQMIHYGQPGGERYYAHDIIAYDVKVGDPSHEINAALAREKPSRAACSAPRVRPSRRPRSSPRFNSTTSTSTGAATSPFMPATAPLSCTASIPKAPLACRSSTPTTSGAQRSSSLASRPART